jgi:hypothetical protein
MWRFLLFGRSNAPNNNNFDKQRNLREKMRTTDGGYQTLIVSIISAMVVFLQCHGLHLTTSLSSSSAGASYRRYNTRLAITTPSCHDDFKNDDNNITIENDYFSKAARRRIILATTAAPIIGSLLLLPSQSTANAAESPAEVIRLTSSNIIPGLGPSDIYYPNTFVGRWRASSTIINSDDDFWLDYQTMGIKLPIPITSEMRFVPYNNDNDYNVGAIADRAYNEQSYHGALVATLDSLYSTTKPKFPNIQLVNWTPSNPNVLSITYTDGSAKEIKVTKRSVDVSNDSKEIFSSEFRRITTIPAAATSGSSIGGGMGIGGIPTISKSRILTKWKCVNDGSGINNNLIEGIEITYNEQGTLGNKSSDPLLLGGGRRNIAMTIQDGRDTRDLPDWRSTKTKILLERIM